MSTGLKAQIEMDKGVQLATDLRAHLEGVDVFGGSDDPGVDFGPWNIAEAQRPLARIECRTAGQVSTALKIAADHDVPVSVCGGREDAFARNSRAGFLVVDLRHMDNVIYDAVTRVARIGGGVTTSRLLGRLSSDIVTPTTCNANVGLIGAATGGGYGLLAGSYGLVCDALLGVEMVLANGQQVSVDATHEPDLFWALRGGGNGFGVVTSARLATYSCPHVLSTQINFPLSSGRRPLMIIQDLLDEEPDRLGLTPVFAKVDDGPAILSLQFAWNGLEEEGRAVLKVLSDLPGAQVANAGLVPFRETLDRGELWPWGKVWGARTRSLGRLDGAVVDTCLEGAETMPSLGARLFLHDFHGYASRVPLSETAFALRENHYVAAACGMSEPSDRDGEEIMRKWLDNVAGSLEKSAMPGGYVNFLAPSDTERVERFYGQAAERLRAIKLQVDPHDRFRSATARLRP